MATSFIRCIKCNKLVGVGSSVCAVCGTRVEKTQDKTISDIAAKQAAGFSGVVQGFPVTTQVQGFPLVQPSQNGFPPAQTPQSLPSEQLSKSFPSVQGVQPQIAVAQVQQETPSKTAPAVRDTPRKVSFLKNINLGSETSVRVCGVALAVLSIIFLVMVLSTLGTFNTAHELYVAGRESVEGTQDVEVKGPWSYVSAGNAGVLGDWGSYANHMGDEVNQANVAQQLTALTGDFTINVGGIKYYMLVMRSDAFYAGGVLVDAEVDTTLLSSALYTSSALSYDGSGTPVIVYIYANASNMEYSRVMTTIEGNLSSTQQSTAGEALIAEKLGRSYEVPSLVFFLLYAMAVFCGLGILVGITVAVIGGDADRAKLIALSSLGLSFAWGVSLIGAITLLLITELSLAVLVVVAVLSLLLVVACHMTGKERAKVYYT